MYQQQAGMDSQKKTLDKVNKNDYIMLIGNINSRVGSNKVTDTVGTNGEAALNTDVHAQIQHFVSNY